MFVGTTFRRNGIVTFSAPGITTHNPLEGQPTSIKQSMDFERVERVSRTGRLIPASRWQQRRNDDFVKLDQKDKWRYEDFLEHFNK